MPRAVFAATALFDLKVSRVASTDAVLSTTLSSSFVVAMCSLFRRLRHQRTTTFKLTDYDSTGTIGDRLKVLVVCLW